MFLVNVRSEKDRKFGQTKLLAAPSINDILYLADQAYQIIGLEIPCGTSAHPLEELPLQVICQPVGFDKENIMLPIGAQKPLTFNVHGQHEIIESESGKNHFYDSMPISDSDFAKEILAHSETKENPEAMPVQSQYYLQEERSLIQINTAHMIPRSGDTLWLTHPNRKIKINRVIFYKDCVIYQMPSIMRRAAPPRQLPTPPLSPVPPTTPKPQHLRIRPQVKAKGGPAAKPGHEEIEINPSRFPLTQKYIKPLTDHPPTIDAAFTKLSKTLRELFYVKQFNRKQVLRGAGIFAAQNLNLVFAYIPFVNEFSKSMAQKCADAVKDAYIKRDKATIGSPTAQPVDKMEAGLHFNFEDSAKTVTYLYHDMLGAFKEVINATALRDMNDTTKLKSYTWDLLKLCHLEKTIRPYIDFLSVFTEYMYTDLDKISEHINQLLPRYYEQAEAVLQMSARDSKIAS